MTKINDNYFQEDVLPSISSLYDKLVKISSLNDMEIKKIFMIKLQEQLSLNSMENIKTIGDMIEEIKLSILDGLIIPYIDYLREGLSEIPKKMKLLRKNDERLNTVSYKLKIKEIEDLIKATVENELQRLKSEINFGGKVDMPKKSFKEKLRRIILFQ